MPVELILFQLHLPLRELHRLQGYIMNLKALFSLLSFVICCALFSQPYCMDLVKICPEFRTTYVQAYKTIESKQCTDKMTYLYTGLNYGSSMLYCKAIETGIDDCIEALNKDTNTTKQELIKSLQEFKDQINSDEVYNPQTYTTYKRIPLRSGKAKFVTVPYDAQKCYKISVDAQVVNSKDEEEL